MDLSLSQEQQMIQGAAASFAAGELAPVSADIDAGLSRDVFLANLKKLAELGFMGPQY